MDNILYMDNRVGFDNGQIWWQNVCICTCFIFVLIETSACLHVLCCQFSGVFKADQNLHDYGRLVTKMETGEPQVRRQNAR